MCLVKAKDTTGYVVLVSNKTTQHDRISKEYPKRYLMCQQPGPWSERTLDPRQIAVNHSHSYGCYHSPLDTLSSDVQSHYN